MYACACVCMRVCLHVCECEPESARPAHLNPVPSNPPTQSQLTSCSLPGPNPHILQSSPGHKVPFCPLSSPHIHPSFPSALHLHSLFTCYANHHQHSVICLSCCCHCSWQRDVAQQCAPLLDKPFEISRLWQLITPIPQGASRHRPALCLSGPSVRPILLSITSTHSK